MNIPAALNKVREAIPEGVTLVAVSKFHPESDLLQAYEAGQRVFGESHVQELVRKHDNLPADIQWHFIGHLQTNKVKYIAPFISLIHAVDTPKLLREIDRQAARCERVIPVLLELHIAEEETKYGWTLDACRQFLAEGEWRNMQHVKISGLMMMASYVDDEAQINAEFQLASDFFDEMKSRFFADDPAFCQRSWGMSHDYPLAICHHSTMVRIGTAIFGERVY